MLACVSASASTVQLGQDRRECVLESRTVRVCEVPSIPQQEKQSHQVNLGGKGGKFLDMAAYGRGLFCGLPHITSSENIVPFLAGLGISHAQQSPPEN